MRMMAMVMVMMRMIEMAKVVEWCDGEVMLMVMAVKDAMMV